MSSQITSAGAGASLGRRAAAEPARQDRREPMLIAALWLVLVGNAAAIGWLWLHGGGISIVHTSAALWTSVGRVTGLFAVYLALLQVLLLSRLPPLERLVGFDRLTVWHRRIGGYCLALILAHVVTITIGYAESDKITIPSEISRLLSSYPGMITATIGTGVIIGVVVASVVIVRRRLPYEAWYAIHLTVYGGIALAYLHQLPAGNEFTANPAQADYWIALYLAVLVLLLCFRVIGPAISAWRHRLRVDAVVAEGPDVVSIHISGRRLDRLAAHGGQFMIWRFLTRGRWWQAHPFSLSRAADGRSLRITVKELGDFTRGLAELPVGTRVLAEGPFGRFTADARSRGRTVLIAGGIGVTPIRSLLEELPGGEQIDVIQRAVNEHDLVLRGEIDELAATRGARVHTVLGDHREPGGERLLSAEHLLELVPDVRASDVFLCGPAPMMEHVRSSLRGLGVPGRQIHSERFALAA